MLRLLRVDGRENDQLRDCTLTRRVNRYAEGSCLVSLGHTRVYCTASVDERQPHFLMNTDQGWVTAEYGMLPRATTERSSREGGTRIGGRTHEIQRVIGRSLRTVTDLRKLGPRTVRLDCDVLQADGGTRTASVVAAYVALAEACAWLQGKKLIKAWPLLCEAAAISVGIVTGEVLLDLCYTEDSQALVDMNVVMTSHQEIIEVQGTGEGRPFTRQEHDRMLDMAWRGIQTLLAKQKTALAGVGPYPAATSQ
jgi:ribonuclease PH